VCILPQLKTHTRCGGSCLQSQHSGGWSRKTLSLEASLCYTVRPCFKKQKFKKQHFLNEQPTYPSKGWLWVWTRFVYPFTVHRGTFFMMQKSHYFSFLSISAPVIPFQPSPFVPLFSWGLGLKRQSQSTQGLFLKTVFSLGATLCRSHVTCVKWMKTWGKQMTNASLARSGD
jgi:hypothetical protein